MKKLFILLLTVFMSVASLSAQSTDVKKLEQQASQGKASAQYNLGLRYTNGQGVPQDYVQAAKWYRLAAVKLDGKWGFVDKKGNEYWDMTEDQAREQMKKR